MTHWLKNVFRRDCSVVDDPTKSWEVWWGSVEGLQRAGGGREGGGSYLWYFVAKDWFRWSLCDVASEPGSRRSWPQLPFWRWCPGNMERVKSGNCFTDSHVIGYVTFLFYFFELFVWITMVMMSIFVFLIWLSNAANPVSVCVKLSAMSVGQIPFGFCMLTSVHKMFIRFIFAKDMQLHYIWY